MSKKTVEDIDVGGKRVLLRVDFNVPLGPDGGVSDDTRIRKSLPTIKYLIDHGAKVVLCSHFGRPKGKVVEEMRLAPAAKHLAELLGKPVPALQEIVGAEVEQHIAQMRPGEVVLLENLRFHPGEEENDPDFSRSLARLSEVYVNDAFGSSHRAHASVVGVARYLPAVSGFLMKKELESLGGILESPERPFAALIGGAKVSGKLGVLENIVTRVDSLLIGGGMVATFIQGSGHDTGASMVDADKIAYVQQLMQKAKSLGVQVLIPEDLVVADKLEAGAESKVVSAEQIPAGWYIADIGPRSVERFAEELSQSRTVIWNGPVGVFEISDFAEGTRRLASLIAELDGTTIIGGGSTSEAVAMLGLADKMTHVSTGGGASLEFLEGRALPGVEALLDRHAAVPHA